jgi:hypothetical protein
MGMFEKMKGIISFNDFWGDTPGIRDRGHIDAWNGAGAAGVVKSHYFTNSKSIWFWILP